MPPALRACSPPIRHWFHAPPHLRIQEIRRRGVDQLHPALGQRMQSEEGIVSGRDHVDNRVAYGDDIKAGLGHGGMSLGELLLALAVTMAPPLCKIMRAR
jgi:hypothetical protein